MTETKMNFEAEVGRLLDIVANALYSDREVFLRELISNASDACEHHRYLTLTNKKLKDQTTDYAIVITADKENKTLTISDNGVGMSRDDLVTHLGTIARSGTAALVEKISKSKKGDAKADMIGQFGVGFYASFMVADKVDVLSFKAGEKQAYLWSSDGKTGYTIAEAEKAKTGTDIILSLKEDALEFVEEMRIKHIVTKYSDHIAIPIQMGDETLNKANALWQQSSNSVSEEDYKSFYTHITDTPGEPWMNIHWRAEGMIEYAGLLYIPSMRPFDLYDPRRHHSVKLYVKRVFITENCEGLIPPYLRFVKGVVDSQDLPLNVSREMLQNNPVVRKISNGIVKKVLGTIEKIASEDETGYKDFLHNFGSVLKEGLYEDASHRDQIFKILRFKTTNGDEATSLADYVSRMKDDQNEIFYLTGENIDAMRVSPHLEGFKAKGIEVLLLDESIDEFWLPAVNSFEGKEFKSVTRVAADKPTNDDDKKDEETKTETDPVAKFIKDTLGTSVRDVRLTTALTNSPVRLVSADGDIDMNMERLLRQHNQLDKSFTRILEINGDHSVVKKLKSMLDSGQDNELAADTAWLLLDQARIMEGENVLDSQKFAQRLANALEKGLMSA